jgi:Asp-tRNA(Asn)/Glu-tRNA(Gln) amidotransferase A subunit family amidase
LKDLRVGVIEGRGGAVGRDDRKVLEGLGVKLVPVTLPDKLPVGAIQPILSVEASAAFDDITRAGTLGGIGRSWPATFRRGRFVPAVEYLRAQRVRTLLMQEMAKLMEQVDLYVCPGGTDLLISNLTGHPTVVVPNGVRKAAGGSEASVALTFTGRLWGEAEVLAVAKAYQDATGHHTRRPPLEKAINGEGKG